ncbi:MAG: hypothetical protein ACKPJA_09360 [Microcystis panniformis]
MIGDYLVEYLVLLPWGNREIGKWGSGEVGTLSHHPITPKPYHPKTLSPYFLTPAYRRLN